MDHYYIPNATKIYHDQEKNLKIDRVRNLQAIGRKSRSMKLKFNPRVKKIQKVGGVQVWLVDGSMIRKHFDVDFTSGGHGYRYLYVPIGEIWIDNALNAEDIRPTVWHEFVERHLMQRGWGYNDGHDYAARVEIGIRRGIEFVLPVVNIDQSRNDFCGAAALKMALEYWGEDLSEKEIVKLANTRVGVGTDPKDMVSTSKKLGFKVEWREGWTPNQVKKTLEKGRPIIVNFQETHKLGEGHYNLIIGYTQDEFIFSNPSGGKDFRREKIAHFMKRWYELEDKTKQEGIVIYK